MVGQKKMHTTGKQRRTFATLSLELELRSSGRGWSLFTTTTETSAARRKEA